MIEDICKYSEVAGLTINTDKTVILAKKDGLLRLRESKKEIKIVNETTYLGQLITLDCGIETEVEIRISKARANIGHEEALSKDLSALIKKVKFLICVYVRH